MATATDTPLHDQHQPTRRLALRGLAAAGTAAVVAGPAAATADVDPHPAWKRQAEALSARIAAGEFSDEACEALGDDWRALHDRIAETPARTLAGIAVQVKLAIECDAEGSILGECEVLALENAFARAPGRGGVTMTDDSATFEPGLALEFELGPLGDVQDRLEVLLQLAEWLQCRDQSEPDGFPSALATACKDLKREFDHLYDQTLARMHELEELRKVCERKAA
jgi:hypothetical protein